MAENIYRLQEMDREELEDALISVRAEILDKVNRMSNMWEEVVELNKKKKLIQIRLQYFGVKLKDQ